MDNTNKGIIFKNDYKEKETHPDYKGKINVDGTDKDIALWVKEGKKGKFFSVAISEPYKKQMPEEVREEIVDKHLSNTVSKKIEEDDLPF